VPLHAKEPCGTPRRNLNPAAAPSHDQRTNRAYGRFALPLQALSATVTYMGGAFVVTVLTKSQRGCSIYLIVGTNIEQ
jgi:hypothetical protein